jgi:hypothetical protein
MKKTPILPLLLAVMMLSATAAFAQTAEYFHADKQARLYNGISSFQVMRNDLILKKMNLKSAEYGFSAVFLDKKLDAKNNGKLFAGFMKNNPSKKNYFVIIIGPDMKAKCKASSRSADSLAKGIIERSTYNDTVLANLLVHNLVETMRHR